MISNTEINAIVERITPGLIDLRRSPHAKPELAFEEHETALALAEYLEGVGLEVRTGVGRTGVVGQLHGGAPGRWVGIRADMDALPITEESSVPFASKVHGRMHACGHDVHSVIALGVAHALFLLRGRLKGGLKVILQPAEEVLSGAPAMIADGVLENPSMDVVLGYHNWPLIEAGLVGYHPDVVMASSDRFDIVLHGKSGHAAHPHTGIDAIVGAAHFVSMLQTVVSCEIAPAIPAVVTVGQIEGGTARNLVAERVVLKGTARTLDSTASKQVEASVRRIVEGLASSLRLRHELTWQRQVPVLRNEPRILARLLRAACDMLGEDKVVDPPSMGSEDFACFGDHLPVGHLKIGSRIEGLDTAIHRSNYECNELAIPIGIRALTRAVFDLLDDRSASPAGQGGLRWRRTMS